MAPRSIRLKYDGTCRSCSKPLRVGSTAWWEQGRGVACTTCGPSSLTTPTRTSTRAPSSRASAPTPFAAPSRATTARPADQHRWEALCDYLLACVEAGDRTSNAALEHPSTWHALEANPLLHPDQHVAAPVDALAANRAGAITLRVGWPVLAVPRDDVTDLIPLLIAEADILNDRLVLLDSPTLNPHVAGVLDPADVALADELVAELGADNPATTVQAIIGAIGLDSEPLDDDPHDPAPAPTVQNVVLLEQLQGTPFTAALRDELRDLRSRTDWEGTAAAAFLRDITPAADAVPLLVAPLPLNDSQIDAAASMAAPLTVITGPPGTGKSQVVTAVAATAWMRGETVLITSTNNAAVDVAAARLQATHPVLMLRSGNQERREELTRTAAHLASQASATTATNLSRVTTAWAQLEQLRRHSAERSQCQLDLLAAHLALDDATPPVVFDREQPRASAAPAVRRIAKLAARERVGAFGAWRLRRAMAKAGVSPAASRPALLAWSQAWVRCHDLEARLAALGPLATAEVVTAVEREWQDASAAALQAVAATACSQGVSALRGLAVAGSRGPVASTSTLRFLRGWAATALSLRRTLPLQAGVVDMLVLDEASQCTVAHVLPAAYRAKRAVVLGDPQQLRPVTRITTEQEAAAADRAGLSTGDIADRRLSFRTDSAYDAFARSAGHEHLLAEHYRCHPEISGWFNREFYGGSLTVLTAVDRSRPRGIARHPVEGEAVKGSRGSWVNLAEAEAVAALAVELVADGDTLGIVAPYAAQAEVARRILEEQQGEEWMRAHDVAVATAHRFQGSERDVILFSTVVTPGMPERSARWVERERYLVNVGVSRARRLLAVVGHPDAPAAHQLHTLASLWTADSIADDGVAVSLTLAEARLKEVFEPAFGDLRPRERVEGHEVDFAWTAPWGMTVALEIDDDRPDAAPSSRRRDIERDRALNAVGWQVVRVPGWYCHVSPERVVESLREAFVVLADPTSSVVEVRPRPW